MVAVSPSEAEYYGMVKGASVALPLQSVLKDFDIECGIVLKSDASAAIAIVSRRGLGQVRHRSLSSAVASQGTKRRHHTCQSNVADALTKYVSQDGMLTHMRSTSHCITE